MSFKGGRTVRWVRIVTAVTVMCMLIAMPVSAAQDHGSLPPLPEWPIIGPLLRMLGLVKPTPPTPPPSPTPDPNLPEYRITTLEDIKELQDLEAGMRVRVVLAEKDANSLIAQLLGQQATVTVSFEQGYLTLMATVDQSLLKHAGVDLPAIDDGELEIYITAAVRASGCQPMVTLNKVEISGWSLGLRTAAQRAIDERLPDIWPTQVCLEQVFLTPGQIAVEGYRR